MIRGRSDLSGVRRIVVKIGSSLLADATSGIRREAIDRLADEVAALHARGIEVAIVSSGAVALGRVRMGWGDRKLTVHEKQAAAAIGQPHLMRAYSRAFERHGRMVAQMLLTKDDLRHRRRYLNASNTSETLFSAGVVPVVNENDTVVVEEIKFGDNDSLAALVSLLIDADLLVIMTDVDGFYDRSPEAPGARRLDVVEHLTPAIIQAAGGVGSSFGTGGMASKIDAVRISTRGGVAVAIVNGQRRHALSSLLAGADTGTLFLCSGDRHSKRQHWIADVLTPVGAVRVDAGAERALLECGGSLLPVGIIEVTGHFDKGECIDIVGQQGKPIARGLTNYNAEDLRRIQGHPSQEIESILGYMDFSSVIHRDNLVLL